MSKNKQPAKSFRRKTCVIATEIAISLMVAPLAFAQQAAEKVEKLEITGSRIPSPTVEGTSPVAVITRRGHQVRRREERREHAQQPAAGLRGSTAPRSRTARPARPRSTCATSARSARWSWSTASACPRQPGRWHARLRGRPEPDPGLAHQARRRADGRRLRGLRLGCRRGRGELHHGRPVPGRSGRRQPQLLQPPAEQPEGRRRRRRGARATEP